MGVNYFTDAQVVLLRANPHVDKVSHKAITYSEAFKQHFMHERQTGRSPAEIFRAAGLDPTIVGPDRIRNFASRVKKTNTLTHKTAQAVRRKNSH